MSETFFAGGMDPKGSAGVFLFAGSNPDPCIKNA